MTVRYSVIWMYHKFFIQASFVFTSSRINRWVLLIQTDSLFLLLCKSISFTFIFYNIHLLHLILSQYIFDYSISMFSVYIVAAKFILAICSVHSLLCFVFPLLIIIFETLIVKPLFLVLSMLDRFIPHHEKKGKFIFHTSSQLLPLISLFYYYYYLYYWDL